MPHPELQEVLQSISRLEKTVLKLVEQQTKPPKPLWVKIGEVNKFTIWQNKDDYDKARTMGWVNYRITNGGIEYDINSVADLFRTNKPK